MGGFIFIQTCFCYKLYCQICYMGTGNLPLAALLT